MLELHHLSKKYVTTRALQDVSFSLGPGEFVGLFGENGAGKTTLMKCVLGLLGHQGEITLDGAAVTRKNIARLSFAPRPSPRYARAKAALARSSPSSHWRRVSLSWVPV